MRLHAMTTQVRCCFRIACVERTDRDMYQRVSTRGDADMFGCVVIDVCRKYRPGDLWRSYPKAIGWALVLLSLDGRDFDRTDQGTGAT